MLSMSIVNLFYRIEEMIIIIPHHGMMIDQEMGMIQRVIMESPSIGYDDSSR